MFKAAITSWKTTIAGIIAFVISLLTAILYQIDGNAETVADWNTVVALFVAMIGLIAARDATPNDSKR